MEKTEKPAQSIEVDCLSKKRKLNKPRFFVAIALLCFLSAALIIFFHLFSGTVTDVSRINNAVPTVTAVGAKEPGVVSLSGRLVVIDAGHGGFDPGTIGSLGTREDEINLQVAEFLKAELEACGAEVIMTRSDHKALADTKDEDMAERRRIITDSGSDIVVSIHMNSFSDSSVSGPLVIFMQGSTQGEKLAKSIQQSMIDDLAPSMENRARSGDFYILRSGWQPCVIVECGYLSNTEEEKKLLDVNYQKSIAVAVRHGISNYFTSNNN